MKKFETIKALKSAGVIAVVSGKSVQETEKIIDALIRGGIKGIEITFRMDDADVIIKNVSRKYADKYDIVIGAGTVLDSTTARVAILAGAKYVVSPGFDAEIAKICNLYKVPYLPGCLTITEMMTAAKAGADIIKLFPGSAVGPSYVKAVKAPMPQLEIMPTGGVSLENMKDWFAAGVFAVGAGGNLVKLENGDYSKITATAKQWVENFLKI